MVSRLALVSLCAALCLGSACATTGSGRLTPKQINHRAKPAIVRVLVFTHGGSEPDRIGSGFFVDGDGRIVTNLHVFTDLQHGVYTDVRIGLLDGRMIPVKSVVAVDPGRDLAILAIDDIDGKAFPALRLGDSDRAVAGDPVVAIGHPIGQYYTVSNGIVSSWRLLEDHNGGKTKVLQFSAPISVGSSGGPLFDDHGRVIGINTAIARGGQNLNFAIPSNYVRPLLQKAGRGEPLKAFAKRFEAPTEQDETTGQASDQRPIVRHVPAHDQAAFDSCSDESLRQVATAIQEAIEVGAPLYNQGNSEACFKVYQNTHLLLEENDSMCKPVREALGQGLLRSTTVDGWKAKAWALRDSFDGLMVVIYRRIR